MTNTYYPMKLKRAIDDLNSIILMFEAEVHVQYNKAIYNACTDVYLLMAEIQNFVGD